MQASIINAVRILSPAARERCERALFLDFDGVLHPPKAIAGARPPLRPEQIRNGWPDTFVHLKVLAEQLDGHDNVGVVVSSSWRMFLDDDDLGSLLSPIATWYVGSTGLPYQARDVAIRAWLDANSLQNFAVLDDTAAFFPGEWPTLILCSPEHGLADSGVIAKLAAWLNSNPGT